MANGDYHRFRLPLLETFTVRNATGFILFRLLVWAREQKKVCALRGPSSCKLDNRKEKLLSLMLNIYNLQQSLWWWGTYGS